MKSAPSIAIFAAACGLLATGFPGMARAVEDSLPAPDSLLLKDGKVVKGLIIKNTRDSVTMQQKDNEVDYPKSQIVRIYDEANVGTEFTSDIHKGCLPPWRVIANDLRTNDRIRSLVEIPATAIDNGEFKNVPYKSFRANGNVELNIYGDPEHPAGIELGIYGSASGNDKLRHALRSYFAGFLTSREEIAALYSLSLNGGIKDTSTLSFEITPKDAPDAYGAWWISLYNKKKLDAARVSDAEYAKVTKPVDQVMDRAGRIIADGWTKGHVDVHEILQMTKESAQAVIFGFYRDEDGDLRVLTH